MWNDDARCVIARSDEDTSCTMVSEWLWVFSARNPFSAFCRGIFLLFKFFVTFFSLTRTLEYVLVRNLWLRILPPFLNSSWNIWLHILHDTVANHIERRKRKIPTILLTLGSRREMSHSESRVMKVVGYKRSSSIYWQREWQQGDEYKEVKAKHEILVKTFALINIYWKTKYKFSTWKMQNKKK